MTKIASQSEDSQDVFEQFGEGATRSPGLVRRDAEFTQALDEPLTGRVHREVLAERLAREFGHRATRPRGREREAPALVLHLGRAEHVERDARDQAPR